MRGDDKQIFHCGCLCESLTKYVSSCLKCPFHGIFARLSKGLACLVHLLISSSLLSRGQTFEKSCISLFTSVFSPLFLMLRVVSLSGQMTPVVVEGCWRGNFRGRRGGGGGAAAVQLHPIYSVGECDFFARLIREEEGNPVCFESKLCVWVWRSHER